MQKVRRTKLEELIQQYTKMRELLEKHPERYIVMDYEAPWIEKKAELLQQKPIIRADLFS